MLCKNWEGLQLEFTASLCSLHENNSIIEASTFSENTTSKAL